MNRTILTIAAHPDDEILGCGGTMARHAAEGDEVHILILAEGLTSRDDERDRDKREGEISVLARTAKQASHVVGARSCELLDFADNRMDSVDLLDVIKAVEKKIDAIQPHVVYTHFAGDLNIDHNITARAVQTACRPHPEQIVKELYYFEVPSSTEWQADPTQSSFFPTCFVSLSPAGGPDAYLRKKLDALSVYASEMREFPHSRSLDAVRALAKWRGATMGEHSAEAFVIGRIRR